MVGSSWWSSHSPSPSSMSSKGSSASPDGEKRGYHSHFPSQSSSSGMRPR